MSDSEKITSSDMVYDYLMEKMHHGDLFPGNSLDLKKIRQDLGISSTPLSNALIRMEAEGFVTIYPRSKVVVNRLEKKDFNLLYSVIGAIEYTLIAESLDKYTAESINYLRELNDKMKENIAQSNLIEYDKNHYEFHAVFIRHNPNIFAKRIIEPIKSRFWDFPKQNFSVKWYEQAIDEHYIIIDAIKNKSVDEVAVAIKDLHWNYERNKDFIKKEYRLED